MWRLSVSRVPKEKEEGLRFSKASMVGADTFDDDSTELDWDSLDEASWQKAVAHKEDAGGYPDNWWLSKQYYDAEYTISSSSDEHLDL